MSDIPIHPKEPYVQWDSRSYEEKVERLRRVVDHNAITLNELEEKVWDIRKSLMVDPDPNAIWDDLSLDGKIERARNTIDHNSKISAKSTHRISGELEDLKKRLDKLEGLL